MCIWIDTYSPLCDCDELKLYEYLYHIMQMLARDKDYFHRAIDYDNYSIYSASRLFMRLRSKSDDNTPIKSILNYAKHVSYPYKVEFERLNYSENPIDHPITVTDGFQLGSYICDEADIFNKIDFELSLGTIPQIIRSYLKRIPRCKTSAEWSNIYISCLLTIINRITLITEEKISDLDPKKLQKLYTRSAATDPVLYHLPESMLDYIKVLVIEIQHLIAEELSFETKSDINADTSMKNLILANLEDK